MGDHYISRLKRGDGSWHVFAQNPAGALVLVAIVGGGPRRTVEDLCAPVMIEVIEPSLINVVELQREGKHT